MIAYINRNNSPECAGRARVVPVMHVNDFTELTEEEVIEIHRLALTYMERFFQQSKGTVCGWNIGWNLGQAAGQTVDHLHMVLVPRYANDVPDPRGGIWDIVPRAHDPRE